MPFMPPMESPRAEAKIAWIDVDPVQSRYKTMEYHADLWLPVPAVTALRAIYDAATPILSRTDMSRIAGRKARLEERKRQDDAGSGRNGAASGPAPADAPAMGRLPIRQNSRNEQHHSRRGAEQFRLCQEYHGRALPNTYFGGGGSSGGWGSGAAFGAKLASPDSDVVLVTGDGFFMFGIRCRRFGARLIIRLHS